MKQETGVNGTYSFISNTLKQYGREVKLGNLPKDNEMCHFFDIIDTEEKAYWLGFIVADGYILTNKKKLLAEYE